MIRMCEIIGLTTNEILDVTGYLISTIAWGVFAGICMAIALISFIDLIKTFAKRLFYFIKKIFRTFGKTKKNPL